MACGHIVCHPGDAIFGDGDGVVVVARDEVAAIDAATENRTPQRKPSALTSGEPSPHDPDIHRIRRSYRTVAKSPPMMSKVLVANRGEIAIRPFHAACESSVAMRRVRTRSTREVGHSTTSGPLPAEGRCAANRYFAAGDETDRRLALRQNKARTSPHRCG